MVLKYYWPAVMPGELARTRCKVIDLVSDGNCMFRGLQVFVGLPQDIETVAEMRYELMTYLW